MSYIASHESELFGGATPPLLGGHPAVWDERPAMLTEGYLPSAAKGASVATRLRGIEWGDYQISNSAWNRYVD